MELFNRSGAEVSRFNRSATTCTLIFKLNIKLMFYFKNPQNYEPLMPQTVNLLLFIIKTKKGYKVILFIFCHYFLITVRTYTDKPICDITLTTSFKFNWYWSKLQYCVFYVQLVYSWWKWAGFANFPVVMLTSKSPNTKNCYNMPNLFISSLIVLFS